MCRGSGPEFCDNRDMNPSTPKVPMMKSTIFNVLAGSFWMLWRARPCTIGRNASICKTEELRDKLLSGQRPSLQKDEKHDGEFNAAGRMAQNYEITKARSGPYRWNVHQHARIQAWQLGCFFFGTWHPRNLPGNYRGNFCVLFSRARPFSLKKNSIDIDIHADPLSPSPLTISPPSP
jgi:hypothetical protein